MTAPDGALPPPLSANRLIGGLPTAVIDALLPSCELVSLEFRQVLYEPGTPITHAYFPVSGVISLLTLLDDAPPLELVLVGREGMIGQPLALGVDRDPNRALVQAPGSAYRLTAARFRAALKRHTALRDVMGRFTALLFVESGRFAACNRAHNLSQRCARWLLETGDRVDGAEFPLTHEFLATMLGVRRAGVTEVAHALQRAGLITYRRGRITLVNQAGIEAVACSCYRVAARAIDELLPPPRPFEG